MFDLTERESRIFEMLRKIKDANLPFIVVGGYAVSAYRHRFSVDADLVIMQDGLKELEKLLQANGFSKTISKELDASYTEFIRYENPKKVSIDLLVNGVAVRQTGAFFSYGLLSDNSEEKEVIGTEKSEVLRIPKKELLIAMKMHSGRLTDFRDVVALAKGVNIALLKKFTLTENIDTVKANARKLSDALKTREFIDSFKGVFAEKKPFSAEEAKKICNALI